MEHLAAMQIAVRVLTAIGARTAPDPADVHFLRTYAPKLTGLATDELACEVIQQVLKKDKAKRQKARAAGV